MTTAQVVFSIALGLISLAVVAFGIYIASSTVWSERWMRREK